MKNKIINKVYKMLSVFSILITICIVYVYYMFLMERQIWHHISVILLFIALLIIDYLLYSKINKKTTIRYLIIQTLLGLGTIYTSICVNVEYSFIFLIIFTLVITCPEIILKALIQKDKKIIMTISKELSLISFLLYYTDYDYLIIKVFGIILLLMLAIVLLISFYDKNKIFLISTIVIQTSATISLLMINNRNIGLDILFLIIVFLTMLIFENTNKKNENY